jgi:hypothetical protein
MANQSAGAYLSSGRRFKQLSIDPDLRGVFRISTEPGKGASVWKSMTST